MKEARKMMDRFAHQGLWRIVGDSDTVVYRRGNEEMSIVKMSSRKFVVVKKGTP